MTLQVDRLHLTEDGLQAFQNADAGGVLVKPASYAIGDYVGETTSVQTALQGNTLHSGKVSYVEVLNKNTVRFTVDIPKGVGTYGGVGVTEMILFSDVGTAIAYGTIESVTKFENKALRLDVLLTSTDTELTSIDVTMSEFGSIPSVASVDTLPNPVLAQNNAVSVLDLVTTSDGGTAPGLACRHGEGGAKWGFYGHDRIFEGALGAGNAISEVELGKSEIIEAFELEEGDPVIIQIITGDGAGEARKFEVSASQTFTATGPGFSTVSDGSIIAIWIVVSATGSVSSCPWPPEGENIPEDWILKRGKTCPYWAPAGNTLPSNTRLYKRPSRMVMNHVSMASDSSLLRYPLGNLYPESNNHVSMSMSGIENHKQGFDIIDNVLEVPENIPNNVMLDFRVMTREPSSGTKLMVATAHYVGDGTTTKFELPIEAKSPTYVWAYVDHIKQGLISYTTDGIDLNFTEAIPAGLAVELNVFYHVEEEGYSTDIMSVQYNTIDLTNVIELPVEPSEKDMVFISENGLHIHKTAYSIAGNKVVLSGQIAPQRNIEILIVNNVKSQGQITDDLPGVVVDAISTSKGINLIRHNAPPIRLPAPEFVIEGTEGIKVTGQYPMFKIHSEVANQLAADKFRNYNQQQVVEDGETVTITQRVKFAGDVIIMASADFNASLGPGFNKPNGRELIQTVLGFKTPGQNEPEFGRGINGTNETGFTTSTVLNTDSKAFADCSTTQTFDILKANHSAGYIDIVAKMRVVDGNVSSYGSNLKIGLNIVVIPKLG